MGKAATEQETLEEEVMKFKKGDLVEILDNPFYPNLKGERFVLNVSQYATGLYSGEDFLGWKTPFSEFSRPIYARESFLKKVNPDGDELSSFTFTELMNKLKTNNLETIKL